MNAPAIAGSLEIFHRSAGSGFAPLSLAVQARLPLPIPSTLIPDAEVQHAAVIDLQSDLATIHELIQASVVGARRYDVAGLQRVNG